MPFTFLHLDDHVRQLMLEEVELDESRGELFTGKRTSALGKAAYPNLLKAAIKSGNEVTFAASFSSPMFTPTTKRNPDGTISKPYVPQNAAHLLAEGEFNRFYIRAVCRLALQNGIQEVTICRARHSDNPRPESAAKIGQLLSAENLLRDLRNSTGMDTAFGCPAGPGSGISIRLHESAQNQITNIGL